MSLAPETGSVVMQARVPRELAAAVTQDAATLGLDGQSEVIREGLRLVHRKAQLVALAAEYDDFYGGRPAPVSEITAALHGDD